MPILPAVPIRDPGSGACTCFHTMGVDRKARSPRLLGAPFALPAANIDRIGPLDPRRRIPGRRMPSAPPRPSLVGTCRPAAAWHAFERGLGRAA
jgi:hypothetical protein